jgi:hypothetical protein
MSEIPRLSKTVALQLLDCPLKAWAFHRLLGGEEKKSTPAMDAGTIFEAIILDRVDEVVRVVDCKTFGSNAAKAAKAEAEAEGLIAVAAPKWEVYQAAGDAISKAIVSRIGDLDGVWWKVRAEWEAPCGLDGEYTVPCSGELDGLVFGKNGYTILDLKKAATANPHILAAKTVERDGWDIQRAAYMEAVETHCPAYAGHGTFLFVCYEITPPYCVIVREIDSIFAEYGERRWTAAKALWRRCLETDTWPGYDAPGERGVIEAPPFVEAKLERYSSL